MGAMAMSVVAVAYGIADFLKIETNHPAQKRAGVHALLNSVWFLIYASLFLYRLKHEDAAAALYYVSLMGLTTAGLFFSNYLGADLIVRHHIGIEPPPEK